MGLSLLAKVYNDAWRLLRREDGQGMVEYGLIIGLIAVVVIAALVLIGQRLYTNGDCTSVFYRIIDGLSTRQCP